MESVEFTRTSQSFVNRDDFSTVACITIFNWYEQRSFDSGGGVLNKCHTFKHLRQSAAEFVLLAQCSSLRTPPSRGHASGDNTFC